MNTFQKELDFFRSHQDELARKYLGRVIVIKGEEVLGDYDNPLSAYLESKKTHAPGTFMIQPCAVGEEAYTVTIATHGIFQTA